MYTILSFPNFFHQSHTVLEAMDNDLPYISIHGLRHTNATLMIFSGVPLTTTAQRLGHSTPATTSAIYIHAIEAANAKAADYIDNVIPVPKFNKNT